MIIFSYDNIQIRTMKVKGYCVKLTRVLNEPTRLEQ